MKSVSYFFWYQSNRENYKQNQIKSNQKYKMSAYEEKLRSNGLTLQEHQREGLEWCLKNEREREKIPGVKGGFIADEMGLGKTLMMIGTIYENELNKTLIVVPPVLINQWKEEIKKGINREVYVYHGRNTKKEIKEEVKIVITSYDTLAITKEKKETKLHKIKWDRVVLDEGHHLRNKNKRHIGVEMLERRITWLISGTPIQNRKKDFYNLCSIIKIPREYYLKEENRSEIGEWYLLRRTKRELGVDMVGMDKERIEIETAGEEEMLINEIHKNLSFSKISGISKVPMTSFGALTRAKQVCVYPGLLKEKIREVTEDESLILGCELTTKIDKVVETIVRNKSSGKGKLIFCEFRKEIDIIRKKLEEEGMTVEKLDGRTKKKEKDVILKNKYDVLILQIKKGCEGLNLQENYNEVYFTTSNWNPFNEDQAIARCHRYGQTSDVKVYNFDMTTRNENKRIKTIENHVCELQETKRLISNECLQIE